MNDRPSEDPSRLEESLSTLKELGYLQSPAEEFVARQVPTRGGALRVAATAGVWVGGGVGLAVGLLLLATALMAHPGFLDRLGDLAWLSVNLIAASAAAGILAVTLLAWPLLRGWRGLSPRRRQRLELFAVVAAATLLSVYVLDALARHVLPGLSRATWLIGAMSAAGLAAALAAGLADLLMTMLVVARSRLSGRAKPAARPAQLWTGVWLACLSVGLLLLSFGPYAGLQPLPRLDQLPRPPALETEDPLFVITVDGLDPDVIRGAQERVTLARLGDRLESASAVELPAAASHPAAFWNEVATGFPAQQHGLTSPLSHQPAGMKGGVGATGGNPVLTTVFETLLPGIGLSRADASDQRELRRPPFWEIAARAQRRTLVINGWATYPAARHPQLEVASDRWFLRLWSQLDTPVGDPSLVHPASLPKLMQGVEGANMLQQAFAWRAELRTVHGGDSLLARYDAPPVAGLWDLSETWSYATTADAFHALLAVRALNEGGRDAVVLHLTGLDILARRLQAGAREYPADLEAQRRGVQLLDTYLSFLDGVLDRLRQAHAGREVFLAAFGDPEPTGFWASLRGPARTLAPAEPREWGALLLAEMGVAPARDMRVPLGAGNSGGAWSLPRPATYGLRPHWTPPAGRVRGDLESLRTLGYIGGR